MSYHGDILAASSIEWLFDTTVFGTPTNLAGSPAVSVYKNSTTQSTAGVTLTAPYDGVVGQNQILIDTSADGTFYAAGNNYSVGLSAGTLGGISVAGRVIGKFSIENRTQKADLRKILGTAVVTPNTAGLLDVNAKEAGATAWNSGAIKTTSFATGAIDAAALAADAGTEIATAVWASTTRLLTAGTNIVLAKGVGVTGFTDLDAAGIRAAVGLGAANLDTQLAAIAAYIDTEIATLVSNVGTILAAVDTEIASILSAVNAIKTITDQFVFSTANRVNAQIFGMEADSLTASALAAAAANEIRDAVWALVLTELSAVPSATPAAKDALMWLLMASRNARATTATDDKVKKDDGSTIGTAAVSDDGTTFTKGKYA